MMKMNVLKKIIGGFSSCRSAVVGDLMLDSYLWGRVDRISPEAPVPVVQVTRQNDCPGGAANVMRNIASLGGQVFAFGVAGADEAGSLLRQQLKECGVDKSLFHHLCAFDLDLTVGVFIVAGDHDAARLFNSIFDAAEFVTSGPILITGMVKNNNL